MSRNNLSIADFFTILLYALISEEKCLACSRGYIKMFSESTFYLHICEGLTVQQELICIYIKKAKKEQVKKLKVRTFGAIGQHVLIY